MQVLDECFIQQLSDLLNRNTIVKRFKPNFSLQQFEMWLLKTLFKNQHSRVSISSRQLCKQTYSQPDHFWVSMSSLSSQPMYILKQFFFNQYSRAQLSYNLNATDKQILAELNVKYVNEEPGTVAQRFVEMNDHKEFVEKRQVIMYIVHMRQKKSV
ncbi:Hypothetical_protein [Hexamita inflata]|uniref:Hypothetical_protein n=1 Tax=Hexamita inflata TaxID=28002 RepID=A0AA86U9S0_9EUKA|nr:Hypothetical protein HINF_LOCUS31921 [Hexamita inflata]